MVLRRTFAPISCVDMKTNRIIPCSFSDEKLVHRKTKVLHVIDFSQGTHMRKCPCPTYPQAVSSICAFLWAPTNTTACAQFRSGLRFQLSPNSLVSNNLPATDQEKKNYRTVKVCLVSRSESCPLHGHSVSVLSYRRHHSVTGWMDGCVYARY